jgi:PHP family Zn ribbon phosphoesterase
MPDASVKCPKCGQRITNGPVPKRIHSLACKGK